MGSLSRTNGECTRIELETDNLTVARVHRFLRLDDLRNPEV